MKGLEHIKRYGGIFLKGGISEALPGIAKGMLIEYFIQTKLDVEKASQWVLADASLWDAIGPKYQDAFRRAVGSNKDMRWLNSEWVIEALKKDMPAVASLFCGWKKASNWLNRQIIHIKKELEE